MEDRRSLYSVCRTKSRSQPILRNFESKLPSFRSTIFATTYFDMFFHFLTDFRKGKYTHVTQNRKLLEAGMTAVLFRTFPKCQSETKLGVVCTAIV